jgi:Flp pilus assembly protein TadG
VIRLLHPGVRYGRRSSRRGQALVEFAFVAPIFFLLLFGIIDFGRYVYYVQVLNNAAREGARYAIVHGSGSFTPVGPAQDDPTVAGIVRTYAVGVIGSSAVLTIHSYWADPAPPGNPPNVPSNNRGSKVRVTVAYDFHSLIPIVPIPPITINGESTLVINH